MAWVLIGGSTNGFLVTNYVNIPASTPYYIKVVGGYDFSSGDAWRVFNDTDSTGDDRLYIGGAGVLIRKSATDTQASWSNPVTDSDQHTHEFISDGTNVEYIFDSVSQGSVVGANDGLSFREYFSRTTSNAEAYLNQLYIEIDGVPEINLDSDASDHSDSTDQPTVIDTVGGNDATGVGFPSFDASVWENLGGGSQELSAAFSTYTFAPENSLIDLTGEILITGQSPTFSFSSSNAIVNLVSSIEILSNATYYGFGVPDIVIGLTGQYNIDSQQTNYTYSTLPKNITVQGELSVLASEAVFSYNTPNPTLSISSLWSDKVKVTTNWSIQSNTTTVWTDKV